MVNEKPNVNRKYIRQLRAIQHDIKVNGVYNAAIRHMDKNNLSDRDIHSFQNTLDAKLHFIRLVKS